MAKKAKKITVKPYKITSAVERQVAYEMIRKGEIKNIEEFERRITNAEIRRRGGKAA